MESNESGTNQALQDFDSSILEAWPSLEIIASAFADITEYHREVEEAVSRISEDQAVIWQNQRDLAESTARLRSTVATAALKVREQEPPDSRC